VKSIAILFGICLIGLGVTAQESMSRREQRKQDKREKINQMVRLEEEGESIFKKHSLFSIKMHTDGYGLTYERGKIKSPYKATLFQFEFNEKKHKKEEKQSRSDGAVVFGNPFIYGKQNNFYQFKLGMGQQFMLGGKSNKNGVGVYAILAGGLSLGLMKPYYLDIESPPNSGQIKSIKYSQADSAEFMGPSILGATGFGKGWGELKLAPGVHAKTGLRFDWGRFNNSVSAAEVGFTLEYYPGKVEQMVGMEANTLFFNGYLAFVFGSRK
jgi:hypothetical protein